MDQTHKIAMTVSVSTLVLCFWMIKMIGSDLTEIKGEIQIMSGHSAYQSDRIEKHKPRKQSLRSQNNNHSLHEYNGQRPRTTER